MPVCAKPAPPPCRWPGAWPTTPALAPAAQVLLTRNTPGYCAAQLLRAPLSQRRAARLAALFELAALPVLMVVPIRPPLGSTLAEELHTGGASSSGGAHWAKARVRARGAG